MRRIRIAAVLAAAALAALCLTGCQQQEYAPELGSPQVEPPAISEEGTLKVGVNTGKSPLAGMGNDRIIGIDVDVAAALADQLGLKLAIEDVGASADEALKEGTVDIVMGIDDSDGDPAFWLSDEYLPTGVVVFALEDSSASAPEKGDGSKIAAQVSSKSAWAVTNAFGEEALSSADDLSAALADLSSGKVDYLASDAVIGMYAANRAGTPVKIVSLIDSASGYCIGAAEDDCDLQTAVKEALSTLLSNGTVGVIEQKWLGAQLSLSDVPSTATAKAQSDNADAPADGAADPSSSSSSSSSAAAAG